MANLERFSHNGKYGYKDSEGKVVIEPRFDNGIGRFGTDSLYGTHFAFAILDGKCGIINEIGETIIPFEYQEVKYLFDDLFVARKESRDQSWCVGVIRPDGNPVIPFDFKYIIAMGRYIICYKEASSSRGSSHTLIKASSSIYQYSKESNSIVFNPEGEQIYEGEAISSKHDYLITKAEEKFGVIDNKGKTILNNQYDEIDIVCPTRFIVRVNSEESWSFGVVNEKSEVIIDFLYKHISSDDGWFFDCFKECKSTKITRKSGSKPYEYYGYSCQSEESWLNSIGEVVYHGSARVLSPTLLVCYKQRKQAVYDKNGKRIVNFQYDSIQFLDNYLVVEKDGKVGVLTDNGSVVIDAIYENIEFVHIDDSVSPRYNELGKKDGDLYGCFSKKNVFDTASKTDRFNRQLIWYGKTSGILTSIGLFCPRDHYSFKDIMILRTSTYAELFSLEEGIIYDSRYDSIQQLTDLSYVVSSGGKYGVFRRDVHRLIIPCEYDRILFEGDHVVLLNKDGLWGAKTLVLPDHLLYPIANADVPVKFKEISILDGLESLFGVKRERKAYDEEVVEEYTVVDSLGKEFMRMNSFSYLSSMPVMYDFNHVLTSENKKFGFVSVNGYTSVPFIYDEIKEREDSLFDVRIGNQWGVIDVTGKIVVSIKYRSPIPDSFKDAIVSDALSGRLGILAEDGKELVPTVYDHLMPQEDLIYCGVGGFDHSDLRSARRNFFSDGIVNATWGVLSKEGVPIVDMAYDCFKKQDGFILAGRGGLFLGEGQQSISYYEDEYGGVYDLFDYEGNMIIGGFNMFCLIGKQDLLMLHFGGDWIQECKDYDEWGNAIDYYSYHFEERNGRWLIIDRNLSSIIPKSDGTIFKFKKGARCTIKKEKRDKQTICYWSFPLELFSISKPVFKNGFVIIGDNKSQRIIRIKDRLCSSTFSKIRIIDQNYFFTLISENEEKGVGISSMEDEIISCNDHYTLLTIPVSDYVFAGKRKENAYYTVYLINLRDRKSIMTAIERVSELDLIHLVQGGYLQLLSNEASDTQHIIVRDKAIFDERFSSVFVVEERKDPFDNKAQYWFSADFIISECNDNDVDRYSDYGGNDDWDYERETWYAMTDGMYGDMPDGFDGDYDFLGY